MPSLHQLDYAPPRRRLRSISILVLIIVLVGWGIGVIWLTIACWMAKHQPDELVVLLQLVPVFALLWLENQVLKYSLRCCIALTIIYFLPLIAWLLMAPAMLIGLIHTSSEEVPMWFIYAAYSIMVIPPTVAALIHLYWWRKLKQHYAGPAVPDNQQIS